MDYADIISDALGYTKETLWGRWGRWIALIVLAIVQILTLYLIPFYNGYIVRVLSGQRPAPDVGGWGRLFVDGWKWNIITLIYMIPSILILIYFLGSAVSSAVGMQGIDDPAAWAPVIGTALSGVLIAAGVMVLISFVSLLAIVRFANTGKFIEAFRFGAIFAHIGRIGWGAWILAVIILIVIGLIYSFVVGLLSNIPILGWIISLFIGVAYGIFHARYLALVYESERELG